MDKGLQGAILTLLRMLTVLLREINTIITLPMEITARIDSYHFLHARC